MIAMQYAISLPSDYDMGIIKNRIKMNGGKTDGFPHLNMKAYLVAEKGKYDNPENGYAPFYLWENAEGMNRFLLGGPFNNILTSFGRPIVHSWIVMEAFTVRTPEPLFALVETTRIPAFADLTALWHDEKDSLTQWQADPVTKAYVAAYNPLTWELCHFYMTTDLSVLQSIAKGGALIYDVRHVS